MSQYADSGEATTEGRLVREAINAICETADNNRMPVGEFVNQFFCNLFSVMAVMSGTYDGYDPGGIQVGIAFIK